MHKKLVIVLLAIFLVTMAGLSVWQVKQESFRTAHTSGNTIGVIEINGVISEDSSSGLITAVNADSENIMEAIRSAGERGDIKVLLLRINSPGGTSVASQEIGIELDKVRAAGKKVVVSMGEVCASGGYWIACSSDHIVANGGTLTGSIGVIMELTNVEGLYEKVGLRQEVIKSAEHKDIGSSYRDMTDTEREILQEIVNDSYAQFLDQVRRGRGGKIKEDRLLEIADGRVLSGRMALEMGLVDSLGNYYDAIDIARQTAGLDDNSSIEVLNGQGYWDMFFKKLNTTSLLFNGGWPDLGYSVLKYIY